MIAPLLVAFGGLLLGFRRGVRIVLALAGLIVSLALIMALVAGTAYVGADAVHGWVRLVVAGWDAG